MKNQRRRVTDTSCLTLDRLSSLPDPLLSHILDLVQDTTLAVQTCVLSKRWRNLWIHLSRLHLNSEYTKSPSFRTFVRQIMSKRKLYKIQTLRFYCRLYSEDKSSKTEENFLNKVIAYVSKRGGVEELDTDNHTFFKGCCASLPELRSLKLIDCNLSISTGHSNRTLSLDHFKFASLTRLHLESITVDVKDHGPVIDLFSECVNLEELVLINCRVLLRASTLTTITSPRLVRLTISKHFQPGNKKLTISAPRLLEINVIESISDRFSIDGCSNLRMVDIKGPYNFRCVTNSINVHSNLQRFYQQVIRNIIPKTKSLVLNNLGWKWIFVKVDDSASIEIYGTSVDHSVATLTWTVDAESRSTCNLEYDWSGVDFVGIFGLFGFVSCPAIINTFDCSYNQLDGMFCGSFDNDTKKNLGRGLIMAEIPFIEATFRESMLRCVSDTKNWKCNVKRTWNKEIVWEKQWPN